MMSEGNMQPAKGNTDDKKMTPFRRWSGLYTVGLMMLLLIFFAIHQLKRTGFFTSHFGRAEMVALYLPIMISMVAPVVRTILGKIDPARLVEAFSDLCLAVGSFWLWHTFPFDFAHIADVFPSAMHIAFFWLNNNVGRFILFLQISIGFISALSSILSYFRERQNKPVGQ